MTGLQAEKVFHDLVESLQPRLAAPMNKQKGDKRKPAYLTAMVNWLIDANAEGIEFDSDPRRLTSITKRGEPYRTLSRRMDGCFPSCVNPIAVWEIKEYYYTTTFGSRIADGIYETLLDGLELEEVRESGQIHIEHVLIIDAYSTWWEMGKPYLCRIIDMLHMRLVDEVLFGIEVIERLPVMTREWVASYKSQSSK